MASTEVNPVSEMRLANEEVGRRALEETEGGMLDLWSVKDDWCGYGEERPTALAILLASELHRRLMEMGKVPLRVVASAAGAVFFRFGDAERYGHIEVFNDGELIASAQKHRKDFPLVWEFALGDLEATMKKMEASWQ